MDPMDGRQTARHSHEEEPLILDAGAPPPVAESGRDEMLILKRRLRKMRNKAKESKKRHDIHEAEIIEYIKKQDAFISEIAQSLGLDPAQSDVGECIAASIHKMKSEYPPLSKKSLKSIADHLQKSNKELTELCSKADDELKAKTDEIVSLTASVEAKQRQLVCGISRRGRSESALDEVVWLAQTNRLLSLEEQIARQQRIGCANESRLLEAIYM